MASEQTLQGIEVSNLGATHDGSYVLTKFKGGRPIYELLGTSSRITFDDANSRWALYGPSSIILAEVLSLNAFPPLGGWTNGAILATQDSVSTILSGSDAKVSIETQQKGTAGSFDNIVFSENVTEHRPEVQVIKLSVEANDLYGYFDLSFINDNHRVTMEFNEASDDFSAKLESLPYVGSVEISQEAQAYGYSWSVTFLSNSGDLEMLHHHGTANLHGTGVELRIGELQKGKEIDKFVLVSDLPSGFLYIARVAAFNSGGVGKFTSADQNNGRGMIPLSRITASVPGKPLVSVSALSNSQVDVRFTVPELHGSDIDMYKVEWTLADNFGVQEKIRVEISCTVGNEMVETFRITFGDDSRCINS